MTPKAIESIGNIDAYRDLKSIQHCFITLDYYSDFSDSADKHYLIGRRGSGKSASILKLYEEWEGPKTLVTWEKSSSRGEVDFAALVFDLLIDTQIHTYRPLWESVNIARFLEPIWRHLIFVALMKLVVQQSAEGQRSADHEEIANYLRNRDYDSSSPFAVFKRIATKLARCLDLDSRSGQLVSLMTEMDEFLSDIELVRATNALSRIIARSGQIYLVCIDAVIDRVVRQENLRNLQQIVLSLMTAIFELQPFPGGGSVRIKSTIPGEIADALEYFDLAKLRVGCCRTEWDPRDLRRMIAARLRLQLAEAGIFVDNSEDPWTRLFPKRIVNRLGLQEDSFFYLCRHSHHYPREVIFAVNQLLTEVRRGDGNLDPRHFIEAINKAADTMTEEFQQRYSQAFPQFVRLLGVFEETRKVISYTELCSKIKQVLPGDRFDLHKSIDFLLKIGFIGVTSNFFRKDSPVYEAHFAFITGRMPLYSEDSYFAIHPMFYDRLKTKRDEDTRYVYPESYRQLEDDSTK